MADDDTTRPNTETSADANTTTPKKQRAPRRTKAAIAAAADAASSVVARQRKPRGKNVKKPAMATAEKPAVAIDEMAELRQLEEDNKRLRKALAAKLRTENAELRKRLGVD